MTDPNETQRRVSVIQVSPHQPKAHETDHLCTQCNKILVRTENSSVCSCINGHIHSWPDYKFMYGS